VCQELGGKPYFEIQIPLFPKIFYVMHFVPLQKQDSERRYTFETVREDSSCEVLGNMIYDMGGYTTVKGSKRGRTTVEIFSLSGSHPSLKGPAMIDARWEFGSCVVDDVIYAVRRPFSHH